MPPIGASKKVKEKAIYFRLREKRQKRKTKYESRHLVGAAYLQSIPVKKLLQIGMKSSIQNSK